ncbi:MAG: DUF2786 domain-containing protein [Rhodospirillaceae bacterium]|nr:DUF2786 domain-containing protein [Rhodospirillaceae bacterium]
MSEFSDKERSRFRRLLEVANSTTFDGEREAALGAATRLAEAHGMSLREAAGMAESTEERAAATHRPRPKAKTAAAEPWPEHVHAGQRFHNAFHPRQRDGAKHTQRFQTDLDGIVADKKRFEEAMADAVKRGLDADERRRAERLAAMEHAARRRSSGRWRPRKEFIRILLKETQMTAREIAATAGVSVHDVLREKLLLRRAEEDAA